MNAYERSLENLAELLERSLDGPRRHFVDAAALRAEAAHLEATADHLEKASAILRSTPERRYLEAVAGGHIRSGDDPLPEELDSDRYETMAHNLCEAAAILAGAARSRKKHRPEQMITELFVWARERHGLPITLYEAGGAVIDLQSIFERAGKPISTETAKGYLREAMRMRKA